MAASNTIYHHTIVHPELVLDVMCYVTMWGDSVSKLVKGWLGGVCVYVMQHLRQWGFIQVQLQPLNDIIEIPRMKTHNVFGYTSRFRAEGETEGGNSHVDVYTTLTVLWQRHMITCCSTAYPSPHTAFSTPTAAVVVRSKPWPMWSAWARVRSSNIISRGSLVLGRDCIRFFTSLVELQEDR